jgi:thymidylate kinase
MAGRLVVVEGPSASGKTRAVAEAAPLLRGTRLPEAYDRLRPRPRLTWSSPAELRRLERRLLAEEARRYEEARRATRVGATVLADTGFLGPLTYTRVLVRWGLAPPALLSELVERARALAELGRWGLPDLLVYLRTAPGERSRRARADARGHPARLRDRHERVGQEEAAFYRTVVAPELGPRFRYISGNGPPDEVATRLARAARERKAPGPRPSLDHLLREVEKEAVS